MTNNSPGRAVAMTAALAAALLFQGCNRTKDPVRDESAFQGIVEFEETSVAFEVAGRVTALQVTEGDHLEPGAVIAELDDELSRAALEARIAEVESAKAEVDRVRSGARREDIGAMASRVEAARATEGLVVKNLERQRGLLEKNVVAQATVDDLESQLARATAERQALEQNLLLLKRGAKREDIELAEARANAAKVAIESEQVRLERHALKAPTGGTVLETYIEPGEIVSAGTPVLSLADTQHPYVDVFVPQGKLEGIALGAKAKVRVDSLPSPLNGEVEHVSRKAEFTPRFVFSEKERPNLVIRVRVRIDDPNERLHAGLPAFVSIESKKNAPAGPRSASAGKAP